MVHSWLSTEHFSETVRYHHNENVAKIRSVNAVDGRTRFGQGLVDGRGARYHRGNTVQWRQLCDKRVGVVVSGWVQCTPRSGWGRSRRRVEDARYYDVPGSG